MFTVTFNYHKLRKWTRIHGQVQMAHLAQPLQIYESMLNKYVKVYLKMP